MKSNTIRSSGRELKDRVFFVMGVIPVTKCSPVVKLRVLVALDRLNVDLGRIPRGREPVFGAILAQMEAALTSRNPTQDLQEALSRLTYTLDYLDQHPNDF